MSIFIQAMDYVKEKDLFAEWSEMLRIFEEAAANGPTGWEIVSKACQGVGGTEKQAIPGLVAIGCLQIAILTLDDMLDDDPHGIYHKIGAGEAANLASAFQAAGLQVILDLDLPLETKAAVVSSLNEMMGMTAFGQMQDVQGIDNEADYWDVVRKKSSPYCQAALHVGALLGGVSQHTGNKIKDLGVIYGELLQIHDDMKDTLGKQLSPDWINWHPTLPILFAQLVDHPDRARFLALRENIKEPGALQEAQTILIRCGSVSYCLDQLIERYQKAMKALAEIDVPNRASFETLFEDMVEPARQMIQTLGVEDQVEIMRT